MEVAKRKNKYENVKFGVADATKIPFEDNYFDVSCISFGLHDTPHYIGHKVLDEMKRVSERIVIVDYHIPKNRLDRWLHVSLISLYESKYFKDFAKRNIGRLLQQHGLKVVKEAYSLVDIAKIRICEVEKRV